MENTLSENQSQERMNNLNTRMGRVEFFRDIFIAYFSMILIRVLEETIYSSSFPWWITSVISIVVILGLGTFIITLLRQSIIKRCHDFDNDGIKTSYWWTRITIGIVLIIVLFTVKVLIQSIGIITFPNVTSQILEGLLGFLLLANTLLLIAIGVKNPSKGSNTYG